MLGLEMVAKNHWGRKRFNKLAAWLAKAKARSARDCFFPASRRRAQDEKNQAPHANPEIMAGSGDRGKNNTIDPPSPKRAARSALLPGFLPSAASLRRGPGPCFSSRMRPCSPACPPGAPCCWNPRAPGGEVGGSGAWCKALSMCLALADRGRATFASAAPPPAGWRMAAPHAAPQLFTQTAGRNPVRRKRSQYSKGLLSQNGE
jgi:hypothetical protein